VDDQYAIKQDILSKDKSVKSKKTIEQMAGDQQAAVWQSNRETKQTESQKFKPR
jgi:bifunctional non-homologous end joining protein LigD